jgi:hypothetical protein
MVEDAVLLRVALSNRLIDRIAAVDAMIDGLQVHSSGSGPALVPIVGRSRTSRAQSQQRLKD